MQVIKPGLVNEYRFDIADCDFVHVRAQLDCLTLLAPELGGTLTKQLETTRRASNYCSEAVRAIQSTLSEALEKCAPIGMYFGLPRDRSNMVGFWPRDWHETVFNRPTEMDVQRLGHCVIG